MVFFRAMKGLHASIFHWLQVNLSVGFNSSILEHATMLGVGYCEHAKNALNVVKTRKLCINNQIGVIIMLTQFIYMWSIKVRDWCGPQTFHQCITYLNHKYCNSNPWISVVLRFALIYYTFKIKINHLNNII